MTNIACVFPNTNNIGDYVQTLPIYEAISGCDVLNREDLANIPGGGRRLILNGWYCHDPSNVFPIDAGFDTHVVGFHLASSARKAFLDQQLSIWKEQNKPIGCRDNSTFAFMRESGLQSAFVSYCPSILNTGVGERKPDRKVVIDFPTYLLPNTDEYHIESSIIPSYMTVQQKIALARHFLNFLYRKAELVITTRIHVALPCVAMGVPVIFYGDKKNERLTLLSDLGIIINDFPTFFPLSKNHRTAAQFLKFLLNRNKPEISVRTKLFDEKVLALKACLSELTRCNFPP